MSKRMTDEDPDVPIPHATAEMYWHCDKKGAQMGALVTMAVAPLAVAWRGGRGVSLLMRTGRATAIGAFLVGPILGCGMCYGVLRNQEPIAVYDRVYRLRFSKGQCRTDQYSGIGMAVGAGVGALALKPPLTGGLYGAAFGVALGVLVHFFTSSSSSAKEDPPAATT